MKALLAEPMHKPEVIEVDDDLFAFQKVLGSRLDFAEDFTEPIAIVYREQNEKPVADNVFFICDSKGNPRYMIGGKILVVGVAGDYACSLTEKQIERYDRMFRSTVLYLSMQDEQIETVPTKAKLRKEEKRHERIGR